MTDFSANNTPGPCRILSLDGGGAKGFYTLGVLKQIEAITGPLHKQLFSVAKKIVKLALPWNGEPRTPATVESDKTPRAA